MTAQQKPKPAKTDPPVEQKELHPQGRERFRELLKRAVPRTKVPSSD